MHSTFVILEVELCRKNIVIKVKNILTWSLQIYIIGLQSEEVRNMSKEFEEIVLKKLEKLDNLEVQVENLGKEVGILKTA